MINPSCGAEFISISERTVLMNYRLVLKIVVALLEIIAILLSLLL